MAEVGHGAPLFPGLVFAGAVSLGGNCETAHWLRAFGRHAVRGPFDWLVTPLDALPAVIATDGAGPGTAFAITNAGASVRCRVYGVLYHHEFPRGDGDAVLFDAEAVVACRAKPAHKWASSIAACEHAITTGAPLLFLRVWDGTDLAWDRIGPGKAPLRWSDPNAVSAALAARFPRLDFRLLTLLPAAAGAPAEESDTIGPLDPRVVVRALPRGANPAWATDAAAWGRLLADLRFRDPPTATALGDRIHRGGGTARQGVLRAYPRTRRRGTGRRRTGGCLDGP